MLLQGEKTEPLGNGVRVIVSDEHHFTTDTILLASFSRPKRCDKAIELGSGCGTIPLIWCRENPPKEITAVEIQENAADMLKRSVELNSLNDKITVINDDLKRLKGKVPFGYYDLAVCNPPYKTGGSGIVNPNTSHKIARHEVMCSIDDITKAAAAVLKFGGRFCLCQRPERLTDILLSFRNAGIEPKRLRLVQQRKSKPPKLFLLEGKLGANPGGLVSEKTLFIENDDGTLTDEMKEIYGCYKDYK